ncbi:MAG TPA: hypoxanthine phosphoribosyltransferase [Myxococcaceae bacterium]|nr:hypoxanthine phosphoribosyltransferase [Myxococcaceae bacterium]
MPEDLSVSWAPGVQVLFGEATLAARVAELGAQITVDYAGLPLTVLCVLKGAALFAADLVRAISLPLQLEFLGVASYGDGTTSSGEVRITSDTGTPLHDRDVLVVEDIVDTGLTLRFLLQALAARGCRSVRTCALLDKPSRRVEPVTVDYTGFEVEDRFLVGYGLDHDERWRNLRFVGVLEAAPPVR